MSIVSIIPSSRISISIRMAIVSMSIVSIIPVSRISLSLGITFLYTNHGFIFSRGSSSGHNSCGGTHMGIDGRSRSNSMGTRDKLSSLVLANVSGSVDHRGGNMVGVDGGGNVVGVDRGVVVETRVVVVEDSSYGGGLGWGSLFLGMHGGKQSNHQQNLHGFLDCP